MNFELSTHVCNMDQLREWDYSSYNALYLGDYSCPRFKDNFSSSQKRLKEALEIVKGAGKKCYLSLYAAPNNVDLRWLEQLVKSAVQLPFDAFEVHNMGLLHLLKEMDCNIPVHLGVFANLYTHTTAGFLKQYNVERIYPNPELSLKEIVFIRDHTPIEVLVPIHGKIPLTLSETCFIMENMGQGDDKCQYECMSDHWLSRESGEWLLKDIGRLGISGKDLCMIREVSRLQQENLDIFYIQSMRESREYVSEVGRIYHQALSLRGSDAATIELSAQLESQLAEFSMKGFCNGYYFETTGQKYMGSAAQ